jgi:hypothetical protein
VGPARPFACVVARCMRSRSRGRWISVFKTAIRRRAAVVEFVCAFCGGVGASRGCKHGFAPPRRPGVPLYQLAEKALIDPSGIVRVEDLCLDLT